MRAMEIDREDGRRQNQLRPLACSRNILHRSHGSASWSQGDTKVVAAVYGPKAGTNKKENPEKACFEVIWKHKTGPIGKVEKEYEMILKETIQSVCVLTMNPNTTTSVIIQVVHDDGSLLPCAINAAYAALADAGIPMKHPAVAISCRVADNGYVVLDPNRLEEKKMKALANLVFPNTAEGDQVEHGIITSVTYGVMSVDDYFLCVESGLAAAATLSTFFRKNLPDISI